VWVAQSRKRRRRRKRGKRAGVLVRLRRRAFRPPLPTILLANVQSLDNKLEAVYIPPQANTDQALRELYGNISEQETAHPDAAFIITGDLNKANFRTIAPKYFQHVTINTRGHRILDHCYTSFRDAYKSLPRPPFCKSDHSSVLLLPAYRQKLKREAPALRTVQCWSDQSDAILQDSFDHVDWDMFRAASDDDIEAYSDTVTCFIRKCIEDVVPTKTIRIYPNKKPWINSDVRFKGNKSATVNIVLSYINK